MAIGTPEVDNNLEKEKRKQQVTDYLTGIRLAFGADRASNDEELEEKLGKASAAGRELFGKGTDTGATYRTVDWMNRFKTGGEVGPIQTRIYVEDYCRGMRFAHGIVAEGELVPGGGKSEVQIMEKALKAKKELIGEDARWMLF